MSQYALLICRSQTEAIGLRRHLGQMGVPGEVARPPRADEAVRRLRQLGLSPCRVMPDEGGGA